MLQYLKAGYKENEYLLFTRSCIEKMRGNGFKYLLGISQVNTRGKVFMMGTATGIIFLAPTLETFKV